ncbi:glycoside hydrolase family 88 protein [Reichenbachiella agarivorans]|uniref:Glycoside hydrolase family 88 protein n=1 Tax=Reichenbachiella agarivorans TaxID=2979464 RepID=A0ABY6CX05_9BACT|nr:glycoside hydrolase family 88 protein [Reichenbachiella agarivorans]UXP32775.1 glycoside hydrolase family 88 protein [Reichenbachiella agarivorans]
MNKINMIWLCVLLLACTEREAAQQSGEEEVGNGYSVWNSGVSARVPYLLSYPVDSVQFPRSMEENGEVRGVPSKDWTSGFFPGSLLYLYQLTGDTSFLTRAESWIPFMEKEQWNGRTHDMGFKVYCSIGKAYEITQNPHYKDVILTSAQTLSTRFSPTVGCIQSWDFGMDKWQFPVIIDNMMNLELLFEATRLSGDSSFYKIADSHARKTLVNHYRADNSSYHVIDYNVTTGEVKQRLTHQGYDAESVWSRGQGWGLYGFTMVYRYTRDELFLEQAKKIAAFVMNHPQMPDDHIPYWDMNDPAIPNAPRDASAAAVDASACYELYTYTGDIAYLKFADAIMESLGSATYVLSEDFKVPFILTHSTGNWPKDDEIDLPIGYADYYFLEAMHRKNSLGISQ